MTQHDLADKQLRIIADYAAKQRDYFEKLYKRVIAVKFPLDDTLLCAAVRAYEATSGLAVAAASEISARERQNRAERTQ